MTDQPDGDTPTTQGATPVEWEPAFPGQRPPFSPGNSLAVTHGAYSPRKVGPIAAELVAAALSDPDAAYLATSAYLPAVQAWAAVEAKVRLIEEWVDTLPIQEAAESDQGKTSPLELLRRWEATAQTHRARLGLDPLSRARLGRDRAAGAADTARVMAELHRFEEQQRKASGSG